MNLESHGLWLKEREFRNDRLNAVAGERIAKLIIYGIGTAYALKILGKCLGFIFSGGKKYKNKTKMRRGGSPEDDAKIAKIAQILNEHPSVLDIFTGDGCPINENDKAAAMELYKLLESGSSGGRKTRKSRKTKKSIKKY
jgi:hypothetical protein